MGIIIFKGMEKKGGNCMLILRKMIKVQAGAGKDAVSLFVMFICKYLCCFFISFPGMTFRNVCCRSTEISRCVSIQQQICTSAATFMAKAPGASQIGI